jgi:hypothetical protein
MIDRRVAVPQLYDLGRNRRAYDHHPARAKHHGASARQLPRIFAG